ncbi:MAG: FISUMP domain-containing protein [Patescibacteria group bacterium]|nr:FISUMP domain-containing protein [Patescibacteria group bacterium]
MKLKNQKGFTLIELLVVIVIIGILATLAIVALSAAKVKARDAKRISDIKQMQTALELYYNEENTYPPTSALTAGQALVGTQSGKTFMGKIPAGPNTGETYTYAQINGGISYTLGYALEKAVNELAAGGYTATPGSIFNDCASDCANAGRCIGATDNCGKVCASNPPAPIPPASLSATPGNNQVSLSWTAVSGAVYDVYRSTTAGSYGSVLSGASDLSATTYTDTTAINATKYYYVVKAKICSGSVASANSNEANTTPYASLCSAVQVGSCTGFTNCGDNCSVSYNGWTTIYNTVNINGQCWFKRNLRINTTQCSGLTKNTHYRCVSNTSNAEDCTSVPTSGTASTLGYLYTWASAMNLPISCDTANCSSYISTNHQGLCPSGWHVPTDDEWATLINYAEDQAVPTTGSTCATGGNCSNAGKVLKETGTTYWTTAGGSPTDALGFSMRGNSYYVAGNWDGRGLRSWLWSASQGSNPITGAMSRYAVNTSVVITRDANSDKAYLFGVRCVKN